VIKREKKRMSWKKEDGDKLWREFVWESKFPKKRVQQIALWKALQSAYEKDNEKMWHFLFTQASMEPFVNKKDYYGVDGFGWAERFQAWKTNVTEGEDHNMLLYTYYWNQKSRHKLYRIPEKGILHFEVVSDIDWTLDEGKSLPILKIEKQPHRFLPLESNKREGLGLGRRLWPLAVPIYRGYEYLYEQSLKTQLEQKDEKIQKGKLVAFSWWLDNYYKVEYPATYEPERYCCWIQPANNTDYGFSALATKYWLCNLDGSSPKGLNDDNPKSYVHDGLLEPKNVWRFFRKNGFLVDRTLPEAQQNRFIRGKIKALCARRDLSLLMKKQDRESIESWLKQPFKFDHSFQPIRKSMQASILQDESFLVRHITQELNVNQQFTLFVRLFTPVPIWDIYTQLKHDMDSQPGEYNLSMALEIAQIHSNLVRGCIWPRAWQASYYLTRVPKLANFYKKYGVEKKEETENAVEEEEENDEDE